MIEQVFSARSQLPLEVACDALSVSRTTLYRTLQPKKVSTVRAPRRVPRKLSDADREAVVEVLHDERFVDQPPGEIVATLLTAGIYLASVRTFYRILAAMDEVRERRAQRRHPTPVKPVVRATGPNQVWTWDITKIAGPTAGVFYYVYVMIDLFSRYVVGWMIAQRENGGLAAQWLRETIEARSVDPDGLQIHNDRGAPMTSATFTTLCVTLGIAQSFSRPHVSDDNPFSESQFKTMKYQPDFPVRFGSLLHARAWMEEFFTWHNEAHQHAGLCMFTPADVYFGRVEQVAERRQRALDAAFAAHPERFVKGRPVVRRPPQEVCINHVPPPAIPSSEPPPAASLRPLPTGPTRDRAEPGSRAAEPASVAREPLMPASTDARSSVRRAKALLQSQPSLFL
jgi:putative transposase